MGVFFTVYHWKCSYESNTLFKVGKGSTGIGLSPEYLRWSLPRTSSLPARSARPNITAWCVAMCSNQPKMRGNSPGIRFNITQLGHNTISRPRLLLNGWNGTETLSTTGKLSTLPTTLERPGPIPTSQFTAFDGRLCYKPKEHKALIRWEKSKWTDLVHQM